MGVWQWKINNSVGEVSPDLIGRIDTEIYGKGASRVENAVPMVEGPIQNFPKPSLVQTLDIGATGKDMRIFKYNTSLHKGLTAPLYSDHLLFVFTAAKLQIIKREDFTIMKEFPTNYTNGEVKDKLSIVQVEDAVMICAEGRPPSLIRVDETKIASDPTNAFTEVNYWDSIEYPPVEPTSTKYGSTGNSQIGGGNYNLFNWWKDKSTYYFEATVTGDILDSTYFDDLQKGQISLYGGKFYIDKTELVSSKQRFTCSLLDDPEVTPPDGSANKEVVDVRAFVFSKDIFEGGANYPAVVTFFHDRLIFGNINKNASVVVSSRVGDIMNFRTGTGDSDGFVTFIPGEELEKVRDITFYKSLLVFTEKGLWSTEMNTTLTPATSQLYPQEVDIPKESSNAYTRCNGLLFYIDKYSKRINALQYIGDSDVYNAQEVTVYSKSLFDGIEKISPLSWDSEEYLVAVQEDHINIMTFRKEEKVMGWGRLPRWDTYGIEGTGSVEFITYRGETSMFILNIRGELEEWNFQGAERESLILEILPPIVGQSTFDQSVFKDVPPFMKKSFTYGRAKIAMYGDYNITLNGKKKEVHFDKKGSQDLHVVEWDIIEAGFNKPLRIEQLDNVPLKIVAVGYEIIQEEE